MHHHHIPPPIIVKNKVNRDATTSNNSRNNGVLVNQQQQRRRKKRPNYGNRIVEVRRGFNGFGFTISGQQPCRLSCIVNNSPADQAGLRAGDFLISVNGLNVSKLPHETVVQLIGNSFGSIRMQIAENYYSDSSDEENPVVHQYPQSIPPFLNFTSGWRNKPRYLHNKAKLNRSRNSRRPVTSSRDKQHEQMNNRLQIRSNMGNSNCQQLNYVQQTSVTPTIATTITQLRPVIEHFPLRITPVSTDVSLSSANTTVIPNVANVSAMVRIPNNTLEYRAVVGYLGTIEMPKQISQSSKLQTVRSCIRKLRQEKRQPTTVLMIILPDYLQLSSANGKILATYSSSRLNYVSSSSESENRFFGLVTSSIHTTPLDELNDKMNNENDHNDDNVVLSNSTEHITISNSCHVFTVDTKLCDHKMHSSKAEQFQIECTNDPIYPDVCLEFPSNSEYVVNLIRSMYTMRILPSATTIATQQQLNPSTVVITTTTNSCNGGIEAIAHSPQPSNHSEISTTTSNSDSGIGFNNDCRNILDRIVLVNFPQEYSNGTKARTASPLMHHVDGSSYSSERPSGIFQKLNFSRAKSPPTLTSGERKRLSVRARSDLVPIRNASKNNFMNNFITTSRSCDDVLNLLENENNIEKQCEQQLHCTSSVDDVSIHTTSIENEEQKQFLNPLCLPRQSVRLHEMLKSKSPVPDKLSPQVYINSSISYKNAQIVSDSKSQHTKSLDKCIKLSGWTSLQNIPDKQLENDKAAISLDQAISENNLVDVTLMKNEDVINLNDNNDDDDRDNHDHHDVDCDGGDEAFVSPARRTWWSQISLRTPRSDKRTIYINNKNNNDNMRIGLRNNNLSLQRSVSMGIETLENSSLDNNKQNGVNISNSGVVGWSTSFECLLYNEQGLKTFAEFLKLEYSAENIYFWAACERYKNISQDSERLIQAKEIFNRHLSHSAIEPVNVDAEARTITEGKLKNSPDPDIFEAAQKQIFNLMKYDSYQRFLRSDLYKKCRQAEERHQPLPYSTDVLDDMLKINIGTGKSLKTGPGRKSDDDRRRKSLLPWHRKIRRKSGDKQEIRAGSIVPSHNTKILTKRQQNSDIDMRGSRSSLSSYDSTINSNGTIGLDLKSSSLCRVKLPNESTTIVQIQCQETIKELIDRVLEKRGLHYQYYEVFLKGLTISKSINLQNSSQNLIGKDLEVEYRVAFKLDLPDPKVISVKSKPRKQLNQVVKPILQKYHYKMDEVDLIVNGTQEIVDLQQSVTVVDGLRLQVKLKDEFHNNNDSNDNNHNDIVEHQQQQQVILNEITNKVFNSVMNDKLYQAKQWCSKDGITNNEMNGSSSLKSEEPDYESDTSSILQRICNKCSDSTNVLHFRINKNKLFEIKDNLPSRTIHNPIDATINSTVNNNKNEIVQMNENHDDLLEDLKRAQLARLEDQRGTEINIELPDFLKNQENLSHNTLDKPQPAPRLSIVQKYKSAANTSNNVNNNTGFSPKKSPQVISNQLIEKVSGTLLSKSPPPLPPKPKVLPIKPSNWGVASNIANNFNNELTKKTTTLHPTLAWSLTGPFTKKIPATDNINNNAQLRGAYLEETSSSFV